jgi:hypothetical protein
VTLGGISGKHPDKTSAANRSITPRIVRLAIFLALYA